MSNNFETPIAYFIYNRPELVAVTFEAIRKIHPRKLFIIADGPKDEKDKIQCEAARMLTEKIDWDCLVERNYSEKNIGCRSRVSSGISWFFDNVPEGIILEDDCLADNSFFYYCRELLDKYRNDERIMCISGDNYQNGIKRGETSYYFSIFNHCWGWATWKRAWNLYDLEMKNYDQAETKSWMSGNISGYFNKIYWLDQFKKSRENKLNSWAVPWTYACWSHSGLTCLPNSNLVGNLGHGEKSTHTKKDHHLANLPISAISLPLSHPRKIEVDKKADKYTMIHDFKIYSHIPRLLIKKILHV